MALEKQLVSVDFAQGLETRQDSKLVIPGKLLPDGKGMSSQLQHVQRALMEPSEITGLKLPRKEGKRVVAPGEMIVLTFGARPVKGVQGFWFFDPVARRRVGVKVKPATTARAVTGVLP